VCVCVCVCECVCVCVRNSDSNYAAAYIGSKILMHLLLLSRSGFRENGGNGAGFCRFWSLWGKKVISVITSLSEKREKSWATDFWGKKSSVFSCYGKKYFPMKKNVVGNILKVLRFQQKLLNYLLKMIS
jgi:hypothetical protein